MHIALHKLNDPKKQTNFENCVADVNIPVGEVFTSPILKGTSGILEACTVYLEGLKYEKLHLEFEDGMVKAYTCKNFEQEEYNQNYVRENVLANHETLPIGEFAIGTNTAAYAMAREYHIEGKLPILIAEKTGPHFAVGDTCYSWQKIHRYTIRTKRRSSQETMRFPFAEKKIRERHILDIILISRYHMTSLAASKYSVLTAEES